MASVKENIIPPKLLYFPNLPMIFSKKAFIAALSPTLLSKPTLFQQVLLSSASLRFYSTETKPEPFPKLMDLPEIAWPSILRTIRNWILAKFIVMPHFDAEFTVNEFVTGSKQAVEVVSGYLAQGDFQALNGLIDPDTISQIKQNLNSFNLTQRHLLAISTEEIYFCFPYEIGVIMPNAVAGEVQKRFVEITMCYHVFKGLKEMRAQGMKSSPMDIGLEFRNKIFILNYRFIREFTAGVQGSWVINAINYFKLDVEKL